jgi:hypothetical protein
MREPVDKGFSILSRNKVDFKEGVIHERKRVVDILKKEQERTKLGFIQYKTILELLGESND